MHRFATTLKLEPGAWVLALIALLCLAGIVDMFVAIRNRRLWEIVSSILIPAGCAILFVWELSPLSNLAPVNSLRNAGLISLGLGLAGPLFINGKSQHKKGLPQS